MKNRLEHVTKNQSAIFFVLAACLVFQAGTYLSLGFGQLFVASNTTAASSAPTESLPLYHRTHAREILGEEEALEKDAFDDRSIELTYFIHKRAFEMLPRKWQPKSSRIARVLIDTSNEHQMDPLFLMAMIQHESRFNPEAIGGHGEIGLMQIKPSTAKWILGYKPNDPSAPTDQEMIDLLKDPETNISIGSSYLALLRTKFNGRPDLYIAAYNMGAGRVRGHIRDGVRPRIYRDKVLKEYTMLTSGWSELDLFSPVREIASLQVNLDSQAASTFVVR